MFTAWEQAMLIQLIHDEIDREQKAYSKETPYASDLRVVLDKLEDN